MLNKRHFKNIKLNLKHATHINVLQSIIRKRLAGYYIETYGYITKVIREYFKIPKAHCYDAVCVEITNSKKPILLTDRIILKKCISKGRYQQTWGIRSEKKYPKNKIFGFKTWDKVLYQNIICFIKGSMSTGYYVLCDIFGNKIKFKPMAKPNTMKRLSARKSWVMTEAVIPNT